jgi:2,4-dienoyl-CoA reductase (NADPH2)
VAVGKGLAINPDWVALAQSGCAAQIRQVLDAE